MDTAINNPLYGIEVGSIVYETGGFGATVINKGLTRFIDQQSGVTTLTGNSSYVYTAEMNQGTLGISGSYGVSGLSKFSAGVSAYLGKATAQDSKTLSITWNHLKWAGIEYINFNDLTTASLIEGLYEGPKQLLTQSLEFYEKMKKQAGKLTEEQIIKALGEDAQNALKTAFTNWRMSVDRFHREFGDGLVVGVVWGGWGAVNLTITTSSAASTWKGGGSADFTYAGAAASVAVSATYNHEQVGKDANAKADVKGYYNGGCVEALVTAWIKNATDLATKGLSELGKANVADLPALNGSVAAPKVPDFVKPDKPEKLTDLFKNIKSVDGLRAYAMAQSYEKYKESGGEGTLTQFAEEADKENDVSGIEKPGIVLPDEADIEDRIVLGKEFVDEDHAGKAHDFDDGGGGLLRDKAKAPPDAKGGQFEPLGVWVANWQELFPWLASLRDNRIPAGTAPSLVVKLRMFHQDLITLSRLYREFAVSGLNWGHLDLAKISDSFSAAAEEAGDFMYTLSAKREGLQPTDVPKMKDKIRSVVSHLSASAEVIYKKWDATPPLRMCELGFGLVWNNKTIVATDESTRLVSLRDTAFDEKRGNYSEFSGAIKAAPLIIPGSTVDATKIHLFLIGATEKSSGLLAWEKESKLKFFFTLDPRKVPDMRRTGTIEYFYFNQLKGNQHLTGELFDAYPIPFLAARGIAWKGTSIASGLGSLPKQLDQIRGSLATMKKFSFNVDTDVWKDLESGDRALSVQGVSFSYLGITPEPKNVFRNN